MFRRYYGDVKNVLQILVYDLGYFVLDNIKADISKTGLTEAMF